MRQIEFERKRTEIDSAEKIAKAREARRLAEVKAREALLLDVAEEAETLAKLRLDKAYLEAEEKLAAFEEALYFPPRLKINPFQVCVLA